MKTFRFIISTAVKEDYSVLACYQLLFLFLVYLHSGSSLVGSLLTETLASKQYVENIESERGIVITIPKAFSFFGQYFRYWPKHTSAGTRIFTKAVLKKSRLRIGSSELRRDSRNNVTQTKH